MLGATACEVITCVKLGLSLESGLAHAHERLMGADVQCAMECACLYGYVALSVHKMIQCVRGSCGRLVWEARVCRYSLLGLPR